MCRMCEKFQEYHRRAAMGQWCCDLDVYINTYMLCVAKKLQLNLSLAQCRLCGPAAATSESRNYPFSSLLVSFFLMCHALLCKLFFLNDDAIFVCVNIHDPFFFFIRLILENHFFWATFKKVHIRSNERASKVPKYNQPLTSFNQLLTNVEGFEKISLKFRNWYVLFHVTKLLQ